jgi:RNA polymerase sigma-70 factor (ECF subfamily)
MLSRTELETLVRMHQAEIYRYLRYLGADATTAEDLVQEAFLAACQSENPPSSTDSPLRAAWLRGIARNQFLTFCRRRKRSPVQADPESLEQAEAVWRREFLRSGDGFDYVEALRACLAEMPERSRGILDMRYTQGKSREEMAKLCLMSEDGVKSLLRRVRAALGECIRRRLGLEHG